MKLSIPESKLNSEGQEGEEKKKRMGAKERKLDGEVSWGKEKFNKKEASGICGLETRYSPEMTVRTTPAQEHFLLFPHSRTYGYAHNVIHSHNNYYYNSQAQPFGLNLWHHHLRLHKMTLYKNAVVQYRGHFAMGETHYFGDKHNASLWH